MAARKEDRGGKGGGGGGSGGGSGSGSGSGGVGSSGSGSGSGSGSDVIVWRREIGSEAAVEGARGRHFVGNEDAHSHAIHAACVALRGLGWVVCDVDMTHRQLAALSATTTRGGDKVRCVDSVAVARAVAQVTLQWWDEGGQDD